MRAGGKAKAAALMAAAVLAIGAVMFGGFSSLERWKLSLTVVAFVLSAGVAASSMLYLRRRLEQLDAFALSAAKAALVSTTLALAVASAHQRTTSGEWWAWDVSGAMLLLFWLAYIGYFLLRSSTEAADRSARFTAVYATISAIDAPFLYLGVRSFVAHLDSSSSTISGAQALDGAGVTLVSGLLLSFSAGMFYLYGSERARRGGVPAPLSSKASDGVIS